MGTGYAGWQRQKDQPSVQQAVEEAISRVDPGDPTIWAAGRTDAGVHALGQVVHVNCTKTWDAFRLSEAINHHLKPALISVVGAALVDDAFHARFSARERRYLFRLVSRRAPVTVDAGRVWQVRQTLDSDAMRAGAAHLIGQHDFTTFRSSICQAESPIKTLDALEIEELNYPGGSEFRFHVHARSFLHNQVRSFVGTLERVGAGGWDPDDVKAALEARDRAACGPVCPPQGLYLADVRYDQDVFA